MRRDSTASPVRTTGGAAATLLMALLACSGPSQQIVERHERIGATPPPGPRAVGPRLRKAEGSFQLGAVGVRGKQQEESVDRGAPANVISTWAFTLRYSHGVTRGLELGGGLSLSPTRPGQSASPDIDRELLPRAAIFGGELQMRGLILESGPVYVSWMNELGFSSLPYGNRVRRWVDGKEQPARTEELDLFYVHMQTGPFMGVQLAPDATFGSGVVYENYPMFRTTTLNYSCSGTDCAPDAPQTTTDAWIWVPFLWLAWAPRPLTVTAYVHVTAPTEPYVAATMPYGGGLFVGWIIDWTRVALPAPDASPVGAPRPGELFR